jgi:hypothetical protein
MILTHKDILIQLEKIEKKVTGHDEDTQLIFNYFRQLLNKKKNPGQGLDLGDRMKGIRLIYFSRLKMLYPIALI